MNMNNFDTCRTSHLQVGRGNVQQAAEAITGAFTLAGGPGPALSAVQQLGSIVQAAGCTAPLKGATWSWGVRHGWCARGESQVDGSTVQLKPHCMAPSPIPPNRHPPGGNRPGDRRRQLHLRRPRPDLCLHRWAGLMRALPPISRQRILHERDAAPRSGVPGRSQQQRGVSLPRHAGLCSRLAVSQQPALAGCWSSVAGPAAGALLSAIQPIIILSQAPGGGLLRLGQAVGAGSALQIGGASLSDPQGAVRALARAQLQLPGLCLPPEPCS